MLKPVWNSVVIRIRGPAANIGVASLRFGKVLHLPPGKGRRHGQNGYGVQHDVRAGIVSDEVGELDSGRAPACGERVVVVLKRHHAGVDCLRVRRRHHNR